MNTEFSGLVKPYCLGFQLSEKVAFISASVRGLGLAIAQAMARSGALVYINGRDAAYLREVQTAAAAEGIKLGVFVGDMTQRGEIDRAVEFLKAEHGACDILVNNLGLRLRQSWSEFGFEQMQQMLDSNLLAPMYLSQQLASFMPEGGRIISISSVAGAIARRGDAVYPVTKLGLVAMTRSLAVELGARGICVNAIAPGAFGTESNQALAADPIKGKHMSERIPMQRWGKPEEIAGLAVFLAGDLASYISGQVIAVDGGLSVLF